MKILAITISLSLLSFCATNQPPLPGQSHFELFAWFTQPGVSPETGIDKQIDAEIISQIRQAEESIYVAAYNLNHRPLVDELIAAHKNGIDVQFVGDYHEYPSWGYQRLLQHAISFTTGNSPATQHNKFIIFDERRVITGTGNFTYNGFLRNDNHFLLLDNADLAHNYLAEFKQMINGAFGLDKTRQNQQQHKTVQTFFLPQDNRQAEQAIIAAIQSAQKSIRFMHFAFSHDEIASALVEKASQNNITVQGIIDFNFIHGTSQEAARLYASGAIDIRQDGNRNEIQYSDYSSGGKMHCKTLLIDGETDNPVLITGSANFSNNGFTKNDENLLIIRDKRIARVILEQFNLAHQNSRPAWFRSLPARQFSYPFEVVISEVHWQGSTLGSNDDFIELYNNSCAVNQCRDIDLSHWVLAWQKDGRQLHYPLPDANNWYSSINTVLPAGQRLLLRAASTSLFNTDYNIVVSQSKKFKLDENSHVRLYNRRMILQDEVKLSNITTLAGEDIQSLERKIGADNSLLGGLNTPAWQPADTEYAPGVFVSPGL